MLVVPAIDIIDGACVRLTRGEFDKISTYGNRPVEVARDFAAQGAQLIHVVDLDGAKSGEPVNNGLILEIARSVDVPVQVGGGIRTAEQIRNYLSNGIHRVIMSTAAIGDSKLVKQSVSEFGADRVAVGLDVKNGSVVTHGWIKASVASVDDVLQNLKMLGVKLVVVTDTTKDGLLHGTNLDLPERVIKAGFRVIAAGGVTSQQDVEELTKIGAYGAIIGKAIYEQKINLQTAQRVAQNKNDIVKRIIPCLDVKNGRVVKGTHFKELRDVGDPVELGKHYSEKGADELIFLDITATLEGRKTFFELVTKIANEVNIPFTVGGGISSIDTIKSLLNAGADKVSIGSAAVTDPDFVGEAVRYFGSQCIIISVDAKKQGDSWCLYIKGGTESTSVDAIEFSKRMQQIGVGELLINSLDRDGTKSGFDMDLLRNIADATVTLPIIASSGAGSMRDFLDVFRATDIDAALGATIFHFGEIGILDLKRYLAGNGVKVRL